MTAVQYIQSHPDIAFVTGLVHLYVAENIYSWQVPPIVMQCTQMGAWLVTITIGLITITGWIKKRLKK